MKKEKKKAKVNPSTLYFPFKHFIVHTLTSFVIEFNWCVTRSSRITLFVAALNFSLGFSSLSDKRALLRYLEDRIGLNCPFTGGKLALRNFLAVSKEMSTQKEEEEEMIFF